MGHCCAGHSRSCPRSMDRRLLARDYSAAPGDEAEAAGRMDAGVPGDRATLCTSGADGHAAGAPQRVVHALSIRFMAAFRGPSLLVDAFYGGCVAALGGRAVDYLPHPLHARHDGASKNAHPYAAYILPDTGIVAYRHIRRN